MRKILFLRPCAYVLLAADVIKSAMPARIRWKGEWRLETLSQKSPFCTAPAAPDDDANSPIRSWPANS